MTSALPPLIQAFSGALGSASANAVSYPLDLAATKLQISTQRRASGVYGVIRLLKRVVQAEGIAGLYDGLGVDTAATVVSSFLYYYFYTLLHALVARRRVASSTPFFKSIKHALTSPTSPVLLGVPTELAVGFAAGVASRAVSTPLSVVTVRLQTGAVEEDAGIDDNGKPPTNGPVHPDLSPRAPSSFFQVVKSIYLEDGLSGFWAGFRPTLPLCLTPALTLLLFKLLSRLRLPRTTSSSRPTSLSAFLSGAFANALAVTILYPLLLAKVRIQAAKSRGMVHGAPRPTATTMWDLWVAAVRQDGWAGLYQALSVQILKGVVNQGVTMLVKQRIERRVVRLYLGK